MVAGSSLANIKGRFYANKKGNEGASSPRFSVLCNTVAALESAGIAGGNEKRQLSKGLDYQSVYQQQK